MMDWLSGLVFIAVLIVFFWWIERSSYNDLDQAPATDGTKETTAGGHTVKVTAGKKSRPVKTPVNLEASKYMTPTVAGGRLWKKLMGGDAPYMRSAAKKKLKAERVGEPAAHEGLVRGHKSVDYFLSEREARVLTPVELKSLIAATDERWRPLVVTACYTGMKCAELLGLIWEDIDFKKGVINVRRTYRDDGRFYDIDPDASKRSIIVPPAVLEALLDHKARQEQNNIKTACHFVFTNSNERGLSQATLNRKIFEPAVQRAGIKDIRFSDLRCSYASALAKAGEDPLLIQRQLGYPPFSAKKAREPLPPTIERDACNRLASILGCGTAQKERAA